MYNRENIRMINFCSCILTLTISFFVLVGCLSALFEPHRIPADSILKLEIFNLNETQTAISLIVFFSIGLIISFLGLRHFGSYEKFYDTTTPTGE